MGLTRRSFLRRGASLGATLTLASPFELLALGGCVAKAGYGPLADTSDDTTGLPLLRLPPDFRYVSFGWNGDPMTDGMPTPGGHDGGAALPGPSANLVHYVRNHERSSSSPGNGSFAPAALTYDATGAPGGTTTVVFDTQLGRYVETRPSLSGTVRNCAGGPTPWGSWLSCEETLADPGGAAELEQTHGWVFEVPADAPADPTPLVALGRFRHEAAAVDPADGAVYETEDANASGIYRFRPDVPGDLRGGGEFEMLAVAGQPQFDTSQGMTVGDVLPIDWVPIADPGANPYAQGLAQGGATFRRGEGMWYADGFLHFVCTTGGNAGAGQVWKLNPATGALRLAYESPGNAVCDNPDNLTVSPRGGIVLCEDSTGPKSFLRGLSPRGSLFSLAENNLVLQGEVNGIVGDFRFSEWAGASFSPDGTWLFASLQSPGVTFAITGPWERSVL